MALIIGILLLFYIRSTAPGLFYIVDIAFLVFLGLLVYAELHDNRRLEWNKGAMIALYAFIAIVLLFI